MNYSGFDHMGFNVSDFPRSKFFYDILLPFLGFKEVKKSESSARWSNGKNSLSIKQTQNKYLDTAYHRKNIGINHFAFRATSREAVDDVLNKFLIPNNIPTLYNSPKEYPEYRPEYYAVFFEDPDRYKLEVMYAVEQ